MKNILTPTFATTFTTSTTNSPHKWPDGVRLLIGAPKGATEAVERWFSRRGFSAKAAEEHNEARRKAGLVPFLEIRR